MLKIFNRKTGKDEIVNEPTTESLKAQHRKNLDFEFKEKAEMFGIPFSYKITRAGGHKSIHRLQVTRKGYAGVIRVSWQPTMGSYDYHLLDELFGDGNGQAVFQMLTAK